MSKQLSIHFTQGSVTHSPRVIKLSVSSDRITMRADYTARELDAVEDTLRASLRSVMELRSMYAMMDRRKSRG